jgi:photosystem II stability/assembly factor-like uncharacterized protein
MGPRHTSGAASASCLAAISLLTAAILLAGCGAAGPTAAGPTAAGPTADTAPTRDATPGNGPAPVPGRPAGLGCSARPAEQVAAGLGGLTGVQFVSRSHGWVVGRGEVLATSDGGASWAVQDRGALDLTSVDFISNEVGWAVGAGTLLTTSDGGQRWTALPDPCPLIRSVHFLSAKAGFAVAGGSAIIVHGGMAPQTSGVLLTTSDGGRSWRRLPSPANAQSVCFASPASGWLGAGGGIYRSANGGRSWALAAAGPGPGAAGGGYTMFVQCGGGSAWGLDVGPGAAMSQMPHLGYHAGPDGALPIFAEQYFPHPGVRVTVSSPGPYAGTLSAISASVAAYVDWCTACGYGTVPWALASESGAVLAAKGNVGGLTQPEAASFLSPSVGWVVGVETDYRNPSRPVSRPRVVGTDDGGASWQVLYTG